MSGDLSFDWPSDRQGNRHGTYGEHELGIFFLAIPLAIFMLIGAMIGSKVGGEKGARKGAIYSLVVYVGLLALLFIYMKFVVGMNFH